MRNFYQYATRRSILTTALRTLTGEREYLCERAATERCAERTISVPRRIHWKDLLSRTLLLHFLTARIHQITRDPSCTFYSSCMASCRIQVVSLKWESIIAAQALHIISIFIWGITPHRPDNLAPQILSLSVLWSHSGWSPVWADSAWKAALFNEQWKAWVRRQQVERQIDALQLGMEHFSCQLSAWIIIIKKVCLLRCSCHQAICLWFHQLLGEISYIHKMLFIWLLFRGIGSCRGRYPGKYWYVSDLLL